MGTEGRSVGWRILPWVLLVSLALNAYQIWWGLPMSRPISSGKDEKVLAWGTDEVSPMGPLVYAKRTFVDGVWFHKYPAFHFMLLGAAYVPYLAYLFVSGQLSLPLSETWPYGLSNPVSALTSLVLIARLVSMVMGTAIVGLLFVITRRLFGVTSALFAALVVAFSFPFVYYAHTSNVDIPYVFWFTLGLLFYVRLLEGGKNRDYALLGVCLALAVATKDQAYGLIPLVPIALVWFRVRRLRSDERPSRVENLFVSIPWGQLGLTLLAFVGTYVLAANIVTNWSGYLRHVDYIIHEGSAPYQQFPNTVSGHVAFLFQTISRLALSLNIPLFAVCAGGLLWGLIRFRNVTLALLAPVLSYYLFFLAVVLYVFPRFVLPLVIIFAIFGGKLLGDLWRAPRRVSWVTRPAIVGLLLYSFLYGASVDWLLQRDPRYQVEEWLRRNVGPTAVVEAYGPTQYLPRFPENVRVRHTVLQGYVEEDFRRRAPEYVLLTQVYIRRIVNDRGDDFDQEEFLQHLDNGNLGYGVAAEFKSVGFLAPALIPGLNSRITIYERKTTVASRSGRLR